MWFSVLVLNIQYYSVDWTYLNRNIKWKQAITFKRQQKEGKKVPELSQRTKNLTKYSILNTIHGKAVMTLA